MRYCRNESNKAPFVFSFRYARYVIELHCLSRNTASKVIHYWNGCCTFIFDKSVPGDNWIGRSLGLASVVNHCYKRWHPDKTCSYNLIQPCIITWVIEERFRIKMYEICLLRRHRIQQKAKLHSHRRTEGRYTYFVTLCLR